MRVVLSYTTTRTCSTSLELYTEINSTIAATIMCVVVGAVYDRRASRKRLRYCAAIE